MDRLKNKVRRELPYTMLFADDIVICKETREEVEQRLECWRYVLKRRGMKVSRSETKYLCINGENDKKTVKMNDTKVPTVKEFKYRVFISSWQFFISSSRGLNFIIIFISSWLFFSSSLRLTEL